MVRGDGDPHRLMRVALVVPRYGATILGGAETQCRQYAERLAAAGNDVQVLTTCAGDHRTWANDLPPGTTTLNGVRVRRFPVSRVPDPAARARLEERLAGTGGLSRDEQDEWLGNSGYSEPLLEGIRATSSGVDALYFIPYLFPSTVYGARICPEKSVINSCLHDEPYARFETIQDSLRGAAGLIFNTAAEGRLGARLLGTERPHRVVGLGFDPERPRHPEEFARRHRMSADSIIYAGRRESGKNWPLLVEWTTVYNQALSARGPVRLAAMGGGREPLPPRGEAVVHDLGFVADADKLDALAASLALVQLSRNESFSFVVIEAWLAGVPVIVHADCPVTREHCERSGGGLWVRSAEEFAEALDRLRADPDLRRRMAMAGREYVLANYRWTSVVERLEGALRELVAS
ncbi:MAG: glycosyltransferase family 4 protein [Candidatus Dormibacteria bacterium]